MNDEQIVEYCRKLIKANLNQYTSKNPRVILNELYEIDNDINNKAPLEHCKGIKGLMEKCIEILEEENGRRRKRSNKRG